MHMQDHYNKFLSFVAFPNPSEPLKLSDASIKQVRAAAVVMEAGPVEEAMSTSAAVPVGLPDTAGAADLSGLCRHIPALEVWHRPAEHTEGSKAAVAAVAGIGARRQRRRAQVQCLARTGIVGRIGRRLAVEET